MLEVPADGWYVWVGLVMVAAAVFGVAIALPTAPPPDAVAAATTIDSVAGAVNGSTGEHQIVASEVKLTPHGVSLRGVGGVSRAPIAYGPVTPVGSNDRLGQLLDGVAPEQMFASPSELADVASQARQPPYHWQSTDQLSIRTIVWGETRVTLVGM